MQMTHVPNLKVNCKLCYVLSYLFIFIHSLLSDFLIKALRFNYRRRYWKDLSYSCENRPLMIPRLHSPDVARLAIPGPQARCGKN